MRSAVAHHVGGHTSWAAQRQHLNQAPDLPLATCTVSEPQGYAIGSAGLASFLLFSAYLDEVAAFARAPFAQVLYTLRPPASALHLPALHPRLFR